MPFVNRDELRFPDLGVVVFVDTNRETGEVEYREEWDPELTDRQRTLRRKKFEAQLAAETRVGKARNSISPLAAISMLVELLEPPEDPEKLERWEALCSSLGLEKAEE